MAKYVLECPACEARFNLRRHVAHKRVRCRKCHATVIIPELPGGAPVAEPLPPEVKEKLVRVFELRKLAALAAALLAVFLAGAYLLVRKSEARAVAPPAEKPPPAVTLEAVEAMRSSLALPLGRGVSWEYALAGGGTEVRRVAHVSRGPDGEPQFDVAVTGCREPVPQTLRVTHDGVYVVSELRGGIRHTYDPPLRLVPIPFFTDDRWSYDGDCRREGGGVEQCRLSFSVREEPVDSALGKKLCYRVEVKGDRGYRPVDEVLWYAKGVGLVKRRTAADGKVEEATLTKMTVR